MPVGSVNPRFSNHSPYMGRHDDYICHISRKPAVRDCTGMPRFRLLAVPSEYHKIPVRRIFCWGIRLWVRAECLPIRIPKDTVQSYPLLALPLVIVFIASVTAWATGLAFEYHFGANIIDILIAPVACYPTTGYRVCRRSALETTAQTEHTITAHCQCPNVIAGFHSLFVPLFQVP